MFIPYNRARWSYGPSPQGGWYVHPSYDMKIVLAVSTHEAIAKAICDNHNTVKA
jgi:hypothetical protein